VNRRRELLKVAELSDFSGGKIEAIQIRTIIAVRDEQQLLIVGVPARIGEIEVVAMPFIVCELPDLNARLAVTIRTPLWCETISFCHLSGLGFLVLWFYQCNTILAGLSASFKLFCPQSEVIAVKPDQSRGATNIAGSYACVFIFTNVACIFLCSFSISVKALRTVMSISALLSNEAMICDMPSFHLAQ